LNPGRSLDRAA